MLHKLYPYLTNTKTRSKLLNFQIENIDNTKPTQSPFQIYHLNFLDPIEIEQRCSYTILRRVSFNHILRLLTRNKILLIKVRRITTSRDIALPPHKIWTTLPYQINRDWNVQRSERIIPQRKGFIYIYQ